MRWIDAKQQLPKIRMLDDSPCELYGHQVPPVRGSKFVLVWLSRRRCVKIDQIVCLDGGSAFWSIFGGDDRITHWMKLPAGPHPSAALKAATEQS